MPARTSSLISGRVVRFLAGGVVTYTIALTLMAFWIGVAEVPRAMAYALTHATALGLAFVLNRRWVFAATAGNVAVQGAWFVVAQVGFRVFDWSVFSGECQKMQSSFWTSSTASAGSSR